MKLVGKKKLILSNDEKETLQQAYNILNEIAEKMERAISVEWSFFDDEEIWGACEIIESFIEKEDAD